MKFLSFIYILFSSISSYAAINQTFYFDNSVQRGTSPVTNLSIKGLPEVPAKSYIVSSKEKILPKYICGASKRSAYHRGIHRTSNHVHTTHRKKYFQKNLSPPHFLGFLGGSSVPIRDMATARTTLQRR